MRQQVTRRCLEVTIAANILLTLMLLGATVKRAIAPPGGQIYVCEWLCERVQLIAPGALGRATTAEGKRWSTASMACLFALKVFQIFNNFGMSGGSTLGKYFSDTKLRNRLSRCERSWVDPWKQSEVTKKVSPKKKCLVMIVVDVEHVGYN